MLVSMALGLFCPTSIRTARCEMLPTPVVPSHPLNRGTHRPNGKHWPWYEGVRDSICTSLEPHLNLLLIIRPLKLSIRQSQSLLLGSRDGLSVCSSMSIKSFTSEVLKTQQIFCLEWPYQLASPHLMLQMSM